MLHHACLRTFFLFPRLSLFDRQQSIPLGAPSFPLYAVPSHFIRFRYRDLILYRESLINLSVSEIVLVFVILAITFSGNQQDFGYESIYRGNDRVIRPIYRFIQLLQIIRMRLIRSFQLICRSILSQDLNIWGPFNLRYRVDLRSRIIQGFRFQG